MQHDSSSSLAERCAYPVVVAVMVVFCPGIVNAMQPEC
jgi:hypothetical protein